MLLDNFRNSSFCGLFNGDTSKAATLLSILDTAKSEGISDPTAIKLAARACDVIRQEDEPRFTSLDLAEALLNRHPHRLEEILSLDDDAFNKVAILDAQACRHTWSDDQAEMAGNPDEIINAARKGKGE